MQLQEQPEEEDSSALNSPPLPASQVGLRTFEALRDPNFRWFFAAQLGSFAAMNMQMFIRGWLVFELTGSFTALGLMSLANGAVGFFLAPAGGVLADRVRQKKHVVQICQVVSALLALAIGVIIARDSLRFPQLVAAALVQGAAMSTMMPSRQALAADVAGRDRLMNVISLNTAGMNAARLLMPGVAGWMVGFLGAGNGNILPTQYVYFAMAGLYGWAVAGLFFVVVRDRAPTATHAPSPLEELRIGFLYVLETPRIRMLLLANFFMVFFGMAYFMLLPGYAKEVLGTGPERLGLLVSISGIGALVGSLVIASLPSRRRGLLLLGSVLVLSLGLLAFSASTDYWLSVALLAVVGLGQGGRMSLSNVLIQSYVDDEFRGRVMSIYMMEFALMNISIYPIGLLANRVGPQLAVGASGLGLLVLFAVLFFWVPDYRRLD